MTLNKINFKRVVRNILPSTYFIVLFALYAFGSKLLTVNLIAGSVLLLLLLNIFLQSNTISRVFGALFLLGSFYMTLALFDDIADGEATLRGGYWVGLVLIIVSSIMSLLLILGYDKKNIICER